MHKAGAEILWKKHLAMGNAEGYHNMVYDFLNGKVFQKTEWKQALFRRRNRKCD